MAIELQRSQAAAKENYAGSRLEVEVEVDVDVDVDRRTRAGVEVWDGKQGEGCF